MSLGALWGRITMSRATDAGNGSGRPKEITRRESRRHLAETGRYEDLLKQLTAIPWTMIDVEQTWGLVLRAIEVRGREDPERFADDVLNRMVQFTSYLLVRTHFIVGLRISQHDHALRTQGHVDFSSDVFNKHIPMLVELQGHVADLITTQAAVTRLRQLARRGKIRNDRAERATTRQVRRSAKPEPVSIRQPGPACPNGKPVERDDGPVDRSGPRTDGVQDDGREHIADARLGSGTSVGRARGEAGPGRRVAHRPGDAGPEDDALRPQDLADPVRGRGGR